MNYQIWYRRKDIPQEWRKGKKMRHMSSAVDKCFYFVVTARNEYECKVEDIKSSTIVWQTGLGYTKEMNDAI